MLSILCHFHGLLFARATLGFYSHIDQRNGPYSEGMFVVIVVDECFGDNASIETAYQVIGFQNLAVYRSDGIRILR
jgi:hypothetical protein